MMVSMQPFSEVYVAALDVFVEGHARKKTTAASSRAAAKHVNARSDRRPWRTTNQSKRLPSATNTGLTEL